MSSSRLHVQSWWLATQAHAQQYGVHISPPYLPTICHGSHRATEWRRSTRNVHISGSGESLPLCISIRFPLSHIPKGWWIEWRWDPRWIFLGIFDWYCHNNLLLFNPMGHLGDVWAASIHWGTSLSNRYICWIKHLEHYTKMVKSKWRILFQNMWLIHVVNTFQGPQLNHSTPEIGFSLMSHYLTSDGYLAFHTILDEVCTDIPDWKLMANSMEIQWK